MMSVDSVAEEYNAYFYSLVSQVRSVCACMRACVSSIASCIGYRRNVFLNKATEVSGGARL